MRGVSGLARQCGNIDSFALDCGASSRKLVQLSRIILLRIISSRYLRQLQVPAAANPGNFEFRQLQSM